MTDEGGDEVQLGWLLSTATDYPAEEIRSHVGIEFFGVTADIEQFAIFRRALFNFCRTLKMLQVLPAGVEVVAAGGGDFWPCIRFFREPDITNI